MSHRRALGLLLALAFATAPAAAGFPWKAQFTDASSPELAEVDAAIHDGHADALRAYHVENKVWTEEDFRLTMESGTLFLEPPVDGRTVGGWFEGKATISFTPRLEGARGVIRTHLGRDTLENIPVGSAYIFSLRTDSVLTALEASPALAGARPRSPGAYLDDKSALRQLGLELTTSFLNREGPGKGTVYVLLPFEEIRGLHSPKARLLYRLNPMIGPSIGLAVFGSDELVQIRPYKYRFYTLLSYAPRRPNAGVADVLGVKVEVTPGAGSKTARENAITTFNAVPGIGALRLNFSPWMEIASIRDAAGNDLPFLQWGHLKNFPDFDGTVLVSLVQGPAGKPSGPWTIGITSSGLLFDTFWGSFYLVDEDNWYPRFASNDEALHELVLTIPKDFAGIGIGRKVADTVDGLTRTLAFKSNKPTSRSTFYYGDYTLDEDSVGDIKVELYLDRKDIDQQRNDRYVLGEITASLRFLSDRLCPLDIEVLRAVTTIVSHARGFEGLILLGGSGQQSSFKLGADIVRAHEVAHQWWGGYVRLLHWPRDRWLFEGLAEYTAMEYYKTKSKVSIGPLEAVKKKWVEPLTFGSMQRKNLAGKKEELEGGTAYPLLAATDNVYTKGPMVFQMLRYLMATKTGDEDAFFAMLRDFLQTYKYKPAGTEEFQRIAEKHMGESLDWFFRQWVADGGIPVLTWRHEIAPDGGGWKVTLRATQEQRSYRLLAPVVLHYADGTTETKPWLIEGPESTGVVSAGKKPLSVTLNDNLELLAVVKAR